MNKFTIIIIFLILLLLTSQAQSTVLTSDTTWSGEVSVDQDILVPEGVTLKILSGAVIRITDSENTKTDPEFLSPQTEITVRGTLTLHGKKGSPVTFLTGGEKKLGWAGIIVDGGRVNARFTVIRDAETGVDLIKGAVSLIDTLLTNNRYGLTVQGSDAKALLDHVKVEDNDYGIFLLNGAAIQSKDSTDQRKQKEGFLFCGFKRIHDAAKRIQGK